MTLSARVCPSAVAALLQPVFDADWYLQQYPDVKAAGIDAWTHFQQHGYVEQRWPCAFQALLLDDAWWWQRDEQAWLTLQQLATGDDVDAAIAAWLVARWYGSVDDWAAVRQWVPLFFRHKLASYLIRHDGPLLLWFTALFQHNDRVGCAKLLQDHSWQSEAERTLAESMLLDEGPRLAKLNQLWQQADVPVALSLRPDAQPSSRLDRIQAVAESYGRSLLAKWRFPLVSVIIPCYNAEATIATALRSLQAQSWPRLEVIVVDDASTDHTVAVVQAFASKDARFQLVQQSENQGAYAARNRALQLAKGRYITTHDADDWSHPSKLAVQVNAIRQQKGAVASCCHWVRCDPELNFYRWRMEDGWVHRSTSSLLFDKKVVKQLGFWDLVNVSADTEYYERIIAAYGADAVVEALPGIPLALGRVDAGSLTQQSDTHLRTQFNGLRREYLQAARRWHQQTTSCYMPAKPERRAFAVPASMCRGGQQQQLHNDALLVEQSGFFDASWYLSRYPDVAAAGIDPLQHFMQHGAFELRDPSGQFSSSGYRYLHPEATSANALLDAVCHGRLADGVLQQPGLLHWRDSSPCVLVVGHSAPVHWFGAERSLLDVLSVMVEWPVNIVVVLPEASGHDYLAEIRARCQHWCVFPYQWWRDGRSVDESSLRQFVQLINQFKVDLVYGNTMMLWEPYLAARQLGIPRLMHVRELPASAEVRCPLTKAWPGELQQHLVSLGCDFIANSEQVAGFLQHGIDQCASELPVSVHLVYNTVDAACFECVPPLWRPRLTVGLISNNQPNKGLEDFFTLARLCTQQALPFDFMLFGPKTDEVKRLMALSEQNEVQFAGYVSPIKGALEQLDIVLNLSWMKESFGRTALEAMAAGRGVIVYDWGAFSGWLPADGAFLVPYRDVSALQSVLQQLSEDRALLQETAQRGQQYAVEVFGPAAFHHAFMTAFRATCPELMGAHHV